MAAKVKEAVFDTDRAHPQQFFPESGQGFLNRIARGHEIAVQIGTFEALPVVVVCRHRGLAGLRDQAVKVERTDDHLRPAQRQRAAQRLGAVFGGDALGDVVMQAFLFRRQRGSGKLTCVVKGDIGLGQAGCRAKGGLTVQPLHLEPGDIDADLAPGRDQRDVEAGKAVCHLAFRQAHPADDFGRQGTVDADRAVRDRHPKMRTHIFGDQAHCPAGSRVQQPRMQDVTRVQIATAFERQRQMRQPFAITQRGGAQNVPARAEIQMRLLRGAQAIAGGGGFARRAAGGYGGQVQFARRGVRCRGQKRLRVQYGAAAPVQRHAAPGFEFEPFARLRQMQFDPPGRAIGHFQRAQKMQVADFERGGDALRSQCLGGQFDIAGAGQHRIPRLGAMPVNQPMLPGRNLATIAAAGFGHAIAVQQRAHGRHPRGFGHIAGAAGHGIGRHTDLGPDPPVDRDHAGLCACPRPGKGIEIGIGGGIVDLTGRPCRGRGRGTEHHQFQRAIREQRVQHPEAGNLGGHNGLGRGFGLGHQRAVVNRSGGVDHTCDRAKLGFDRIAHLLHRNPVADIGIGNDQAPARFFEFLRLADMPRSLVRGGVAGKVVLPILLLWYGAAGQQNDIRAVGRKQVTRHRQADPAKAAGDQIRAAPAEPCFLRSRLDQRRGAVGFDQPPVTAIGGHNVVGRGQQIFDHAGGQRTHIRSVLRGFAPEQTTGFGGSLRQFDIQRRTGYPRQFAWDDARRAGDDGLLGIG